MRRFLYRKHSKHSIKIINFKPLEGFDRVLEVGVTLCHMMRVVEGGVMSNYFHLKYNTHI